MLGVDKGTGFRWKERDPPWKTGGKREDVCRSRRLHKQPPCKILLITIKQISGQIGFLTEDSFQTFNILRCTVNQSDFLIISDYMNHLGGLVFWKTTLEDSDLPDICLDFPSY